MSLHLNPLVPGVLLEGRYKKLDVKKRHSIFEWTRSSADADNRLDAFSGQSRSTNIVPFHMLHIVSYFAIVTCL